MEKISSRTKISLTVDISWLMLKALSKPRSSKQHLIIHMKVILLAIIGILLWQSDSARSFTADTLYKAAEIIEPDVSDRTIGETIDSFLN